MNFIKSRRSIRKYKDKPVPPKVVDKLLEAGQWAPSAMNRQPWQFVIITDKKIIRELSDKVKELGMKDSLLVKILLYAERFKSKEDTIFYNAPLLIMITANKKNQYARFDTGLAAQSMFLYAHSIGLGSCWIGFANFLNKEPAILKKLRIPEENELMAALIFGYPNEKPTRGRDKPVVLARF